MFYRFEILQNCLSSMTIQYSVIIIERYDDHDSIWETATTRRELITKLKQWENKYLHLKKKRFYLKCTKND